MNKVVEPDASTLDPLAMNRGLRELRTDTLKIKVDARDERPPGHILYCKALCVALCSTSGSGRSDASINGTALHTLFLNGDDVI